MGQPHTPFLFQGTWPLRPTAPTAARLNETVTFSFFEKHVFIIETYAIGLAGRVQILSHKLM